MMDHSGKAFSWKELYHIPYYGYHLTKSTLINKDVQLLMKSNQTFDLILLEDYLNEALLGFSHIFKSPVAMVRVFISQASNSCKLGLYDAPSVVPSIHSKFTDQMTFWERFQNTLLTWFEIYVMCHLQIPKQDALYNEFFEDPKPSLKDLIGDVSLVLQNSHFSANYVQPRTPNSIDVGGLHIEQAPKALPENIAKIMDSSDNGVIYFALGGNVDLNQLSVEKKNAIMTALKTTNRTVLLKMKGAQMVEDDNILFNDWFPQNDILGHANTKLFITHGGIQSIYEAIYHAVPIVGIPLVADQFRNVAFAVRKGFGVALDLKFITEDAVLDAFAEVLQNESFKRKADAISKIYRDRQHAPMETAIYWIEYVIRHNGPQDLRISGMEMGFIQYYSLDVIALLVFGFLIGYKLVKEVVIGVFELTVRKKGKSD